MISIVQESQNVRSFRYFENRHRRHSHRAKFLNRSRSRTRQGTASSFMFKLHFVSSATLLPSFEVNLARNYRERILYKVFAYIRRNSSYVLCTNTNDAMSVSRICVPVSVSCDVNGLKRISSHILHRYFLANDCVITVWLESSMYIFC